MRTKIMMREIAAAGLTLSLCACASGSKKTKEESATVSETSASEKENLKTVEVYGISFSLPEKYSLSENDGWTYIQYSEKDTGIQIRTVDTSEGTIKDFCDYASAEWKDRPEFKKDSVMGGCRFTYLTESSKGTITVPTEFYMIPVKNNEIIVFFNTFNLNGESYLKYADFKNAYVSYVPESNTEETAPTEETEELAVETEEPAAETEQPAEETAETTKETQADHSDFEEFKAKMDQLEEFFDSYCEFMKNYDATDYSMLTKYMDMLTKYNDAMTALDEIDESELTPEEDAYYTEVMLRIDQKLLEAAAAMDE